MNVGERIKNRRKQLKFSADKLGEMIGKNRATIYRYESNDIENMPYDVIGPLAEALNVSPAYIMGWEQTKPSHICSKYDFYPVSVAAGLPSNIDGVSMDEVEKIELPDMVMGKWAGNKEIFTMRVNGESMNNIIPNGSLIAVKNTDVLNLKNGDIVVFSDENEYSVKRFYKDDENSRFIFRPDSNDNRFLDHSISFANAKNLRIHGKVVVYIVELD